MAARIVRLRSRGDRLREDQAAHLRQLLTSRDDLPQAAVKKIVATIDRETTSRAGWTFVMVSPLDNQQVVEWLFKNSKRPRLAARLWADLLTQLIADTGEIALARAELAERLGVGAQHVSEVMSELVEIGAISRKRERVAGVRGPGLTKFFMNPNIATHLPGRAREKAQADAPLLRLIDQSVEQ